MGRPAESRTASRGSQPPQRLDGIDEDEYQQFLRWKAEHTGDLSDVWKLATFSYPGSHFATFPPKLVEPCIKAGTSETGLLCGVWGAVGAGGGCLIDERSGRLRAGYHMGMTTIWSSLGQR